MRLNCPICGERDRREFYYRGALVERPDEAADAAVWDEYLHLRDNNAGPQEEYWSHDAGCGAWVVVTRNTLSHAVLGVRLAEGKG